MAVMIIGLLLLVGGSGSVSFVVGIATVGVSSSYFTAIELKFMNLVSDADRGFGFGPARTVYLCSD